jgi:hypothetical protein
MENENESENVQSPDSGIGSPSSTYHPSPESRLKYSLAYKRKVINYLETNKTSINKCAKEFKLDRRLVSRWLKNKKNILETKCKRLRFKAKQSEDRAKFAAMEKKLDEWISENRSRGACLTGLAIKTQARILFNEIYQNTEEAHLEFQASPGWLYNFCKRKNYTLRRITTTGRDLPTNTMEIIKKFFSDCQKITSAIGFSANQLVNMDETSIYLDSPTNYTFARIGTKRVKAVTTGSERARLSAAFSATASGIKLPVLILIPRKTALPNYEPLSNVKLIYKTNATFNEEIMESFVKEILYEYKNSQYLNQLRLFLDSARCHMTKRVQEAFAAHDILQTFIPPRMTNLLQPADVSWFGSLKKKYHEMWNDWFINQEKTYTKYGNPKSPGYEKCINWISKIWHEFDSNIIVESFGVCGITSQYNLHRCLNQIMRSQQIISNYLDEIDESDEIDGFEADILDEMIFENLEERTLVDQHENQLQPAQEQQNHQVCTYDQAQTSYFSLQPTQMQTDEFQLTQFQPAQQSELTQFQPAQQSELTQFQPAQQSELTQMQPAQSRRGRPKGSKNKPK